MSLMLHLFVFARSGGDAGGDSRIRVSSVAIRAAEAQSACRVHGWLIGLGVTGNAASALAVGLLLGLAYKVLTSFLIGRV